MSSFYVVQVPKVLSVCDSKPGLMKWLFVKLFERKSFLVMMIESGEIDLLSKKKPSADIAAGIQASIAKRSFTLLKRVGIQPKVTVTGGCSKSRGLTTHLARMLRMELEPLSEDPQLMGALGAAAEAKKQAGNSR